MKDVQTPANPKIYHVAHRDRLPSIIAAGRLWCDEEMRRRAGGGAAGMGTEIGMDGIKTRRLRARLASRPELYVGQCDHRPHLEVKPEWYYRRSGR